MLQTKPVDEAKRVRFRLLNRRASRYYRLSWSDPVKEETTRSDAFRVAVRPRLTLATGPRHPMKGARVVARGVLRPERPGRSVLLQRRAGSDWRTIERARVRDGRYRAAFRARRAGRNRVRAVFAGDRANTARWRGTWIKVYDPDLATWYGPGFYGNRTACGRRLRRDTLGVAHRSLACGTEVQVVYRGRQIQVPVIDRGPYTSAEWDLTSATARRLDFSGRDTVGTAH